MRRLACVVLAACALAARANAGPTDAVIEGIVARMRASLTADQMLAADARTVDRFVTARDRATLGTKYWQFTANVPTRVSVMRHRDQPEPPFWLRERGFRLTDLSVRNEEYQYEVWQKDFPAGRIGLGINGFDKHRVHYFVCVGPQRPGDAVRVTGQTPSTWPAGVMRKGATIYHDWPDLVLTEVPSELDGQVLLTTIRGRAREAHLIGGFRSTPYPSSSVPDQIALTWPDDPKTSVAVQWRASVRTARGAVQWRASGSSEWRDVPATSVVLRDTRILNDPAVRRFTARLGGLTPGTAYEYRVGTPGGTWSRISRFRTAPDAPGAFSFAWLSDTHNRPDTAALLQRAVATHPDAAFCAITGDIVGTGQYRDDWDQFCSHTTDFARERPLLPGLGNHDTIDGLGADLYLAMFSLPRNGAPGLKPEKSYAVTYGNALFVVLDCTDDIAAQRPWLEKVLRESKATWKFALFHFPPYSLDEDYPEIRREWCPLFDRYHVDFVLCGHVHHLERTHPIRAGKVVGSPAEGTIYLMTVAVGQRPTFNKPPDFAAVAMEPGPPLFHAFTIKGRALRMQAMDATGKVWDELEVGK